MTGSTARNAKKPKPKAPRKRPRTWRSAARSAPFVSVGLVRLGKRLRRLRQERELSQEDLAERAALDAKHLQAIEAGQANVTFASLVGLAKALGIKVAELLKGV